MRLRTLATGAVALGLGMALATSAGAADDLTGTYEGKLSCKGLVAGAATKSKRDVTILVSEGKVGTSINVAADGASLGNPLFAFVMDDTGKADRARVFGVDCELDAIARSDLTIIADGVAKEGSEKATLKGTITDTTARGQILSCTFSVKRTSAAPPTIVGCVFE
jgi:hypothetical protein